jgi:hypothetical protein
MKIAMDDPRFRRVLDALQPCAGQKEDKERITKIESVNVSDQPHGYMVNIWLAGMIWN